MTSWPPTPTRPATGVWSRLPKDPGPEPHWEPVDDFEEHSGPSYCKPEADGTLLCGFRPDAKNRNGGGNIHGGALITLADYVLFMTALGADTELHGVTLTMNSEFIGAAERRDCPRGLFDHFRARRDRR